MNLQVKGFQSGRIHFNSVRYKENPVGTKHIDYAYGLYLHQDTSRYIDRQSPQLRSWCSATGEKKPILCK